MAQKYSKGLQSKLHLSSSLKKKFFVLFFFSVLAAVILSPIASNEYVPNFYGNETQDHLANILNAVEALKEGQFPIRTSPLLNNNFGNAYLQFYSPLPSTVFGIVTTLISPKNPFIETFI